MPSPLLCARVHKSCPPRFPRPEPAPIKDERSIYVNRHPFMHGVPSAVTMLSSVKSEMMPPSIEMAYHHNLIQLHAVTLL